MSLYNQLRSLIDQSFKIIEDRLSETNQLIHFWDESAAFKDDELQDDFLRSVPEINHYFEFEGNLICYPLSIKGDQHEAIATLIDEQGNTHEVDIFSMDAHNLTVLADHLIKAK